MGRLAARHPDDHDAAAFHALALLATAQRGIQGLAAEGEHRHALVGSDVQQQAAGILQKVLRANPEHPGAAHYLIHTWDDPVHAGQALPVARAYARIAPAAAHALHMPAHIFVQLGLWHEAAASDEASFAASDAWVRRKRLPSSMRSYHSLSWLQYEYLQLGRYRDAAATLAEIEPAAQESGQPTLRGIAASMRARQVVETGRWDLTAGRTRFDNADELFAIGMSAARTGDRRTAEMVRQELARRAAAPQTGDRRSLVAIMERQIAALAALAAGDTAAAVATIEQAAVAERQLPPPLGPPALMKPASELAGEILLGLGRAAEAAARFEAALDRHPNRSASVLGLARALQASGDSAGARTRYRRLLDNWRQADAELPDLAEARQAVHGAAKTPAHPVRP
jgi:tetratricopeptide (TPR) repeat protein